MRFIVQSSLNIRGLHVANQSPPINATQAISRWQSFSYKNTVLQSLCRQQSLLCCYSEVRGDQLGLNYHIEHIENKSQNPSKTFDEANLAASAFSSEELCNVRKEEIFGGHVINKQQHVDITKFISCYQYGCESYFTYLSDGRIVPKDELNVTQTARANYTINLLNLNSHYLINLRRQRWDELDQLVLEHINNNWDLEQLCDLELNFLDSNHGLYPFFSLARQFFGK